MSLVCSVDEIAYTPVKLAIDGCWYLQTKLSLKKFIITSVAI